VGGGGGGRAPQGNPGKCGKNIPPKSRCHNGLADSLTVVPFVNFRGFYLLCLLSQKRVLAFFLLTGIRPVRKNEKNTAEEKV
jgi:hypothetical protein